MKLGSLPPTHSGATSPSSPLAPGEPASGLPHLSTGEQAPRGRCQWHQDSQTSKSFDYFQGGPIFSPTWVGLFLLPLRHLPHRPVCEHPLTLPTPFSRYKKGSLEAVQRVGTNCLPAHSGEKRAPETATQASETPPPLRCLILTDPAAQPSLAIPLYTPRAGLWAGARASKCP